MTFAGGAAWAKDLDVRLIPYELAKGMGQTKELVWLNIRPGQSIGIFIGPEGGFEEDEVEAGYCEGSFVPITLGKRILRTETAGLAVPVCADVSAWNSETECRVRRGELRKIKGSWIMEAIWIILQLPDAMRR